MKYHELKSRVAEAVGNRIRQGHMDEAFATAVWDAIAEKRSVEESQDALAAKIEAVIKQWDIRAVGRLRERFPKEFPHTLRTGLLIGGYDDDGDWAVVARG